MKTQLHQHASAAWLTCLQAACQAGNAQWIKRLQTFTKEVLTLNAAHPLRRPVVEVNERKLSYRFMAAEALWILSGRDDLAGIAANNKRYAEFSDDGVRLAGAYGPPFVAQLPYAIDCLVRDRTSRQAVISLWKPSPASSKDIPCTLTLQYLVRNGLLHCVANMRSSDLWLGLPYDLFTFSCLAYRVIQGVNREAVEERRALVRPGNLYWTAASAHLYKTNWEEAKKLLLARSHRAVWAYDDVELPAVWEHSTSVMMEQLTSWRDREPIRRNT